MPRSKKWRKIDFIPKCGYFIHGNNDKGQLGEVKLKIEIIRRKFIGNLSRIECALIIENARETVQKDIVGENFECKKTNNISKNIKINIDSTKSRPRYHSLTDFCY